MKKLFALFILILLTAAFSITAAATEVPLRLFSVEPEKDLSAEEVYAFAMENGFDGIIIEDSKDSVDFYKEIKAAAGESFEIFVMGSVKELKKLPEEAKIIISSETEEKYAVSLLEKHKKENTAFYIPFDDASALSLAEEYYQKGYFETVFIQNLRSCYSEYGYEQYLVDVSSRFEGANIITVNDLGRVLVPVARGDFFGDAFELNNQYLVNSLYGAGFCVSDYSELLENRNGSGSFLIQSFESEVLEKYADFSFSTELAITRPTKSPFTVSTDKYTIFGTSDPEQPLYFDGEELERISSGGLFAVSVEVPSKGEKTYTFTQGSNSVSVTLKKPDNSGSSSTTSSLSSRFPSSTQIINSTTAGEVSISCVGPSGGKVTAEIGGKTVTLKQAAYAENGVPAWFNAKVDLSGEYPEDEVTLIGKVTYTLVYKGETKTYESSSNFYYVGENASFAIKAAVNLAGVEKGPKDSGDYLTTLRIGCADYVTEIAESGWYKLSCGGYINPSHCNIITGKTDITNRISSVEREIGENYEKLVFDCSVIPSFIGNIDGRSFSITLYNTEWGDFASTDLSSTLMYRINPVDNGDGSITVNFYSKKDLWGWDFFTDPENGTFSVVLKGTPTLSDEHGKPLSGITVTVCAGHGGPDPGALSPAGETGVTEAQINIANTLAIAEALENLGAKIVLLYTEDEKLDTYGRTDPARYSYSDLYICCHANAVAESSAANLWCGTYVYYHYDHSAVFSEKLSRYISSATRRDNEGAHQDYYSVTRLTMCPAVMLEVGFISNPKEVESLTDKRDIQKTAFAVTKAVLEILDN